MSESTAREWNSAIYHKVSNPQFEWGLKVLNRLELRGDERVMDAGCGTGRLTAKLLDRLPHGPVVAVDLSQNMLQQAAEHLSQYNGHVTFLHADLPSLTFDCEFDVIFSTATFHWVLDHDALFAALFRALKPGGKIEAQCGGGPNLQNAHQRIRALMDSMEFSKFFVDWKFPWEFASAETTAERMKRAGFVDVETSTEPSPVRLNGVDEYRGFLPTVILRPFLNTITDEKLRADFAEEIVQQAASDPSFELDYWRLNLRGSKW